MQWIAAIAKHQHFDENRTAFNVCSRHFNEADFLLRNNKKVLKLNAVPKIFNDSPNVNYMSQQKNENSTQNEWKEKCNILEDKVAQLEKEILCMKVQHDIEIQKLRIKSEKVHNAQSNLQKETKKELSKQKSEIIRMEDVIQELHKQHYISPDDAKFLNVSFKF